jgi:hypothetical protein
MGNIQQLLLVMLPIIIGVALVFGVMVFLTRNDNDARDPTLTTKFQQYNASAQLHFRRYRTYEDVCDQIALPESVSCMADEDEYAIYQRLIQKGFYCIDSTGFVGEVPTISTRIRCQL